MRCCASRARLAAACLAIFAGSAAAGDATPEQLEFFETKIRPVLVEHCYGCHSQEGDALEAGLALDSADGWQVGGDSGPAIAPGDPDASLLVSALAYESVEMPPEGRLPQQIVDDFREWIALGAPDPRTGEGPRPQRGGIDVEAGRRLWSFQPPDVHAVPEVDDAGWPRSDVDRFVLAELEQAGLAPGPDADPATRLRRLAFDLTGLPPSPALVRRFAADPTPAHWRRIVDALLASPEHAEHWGRHWLDVARYADSNGSDFNATFHEAWRYRDYVIRSVAADKPYDQFVREQIAGDLLAAATPEERAEQIVATGFLAIGAKMLSERHKEKLRMDVVDEQVDTTGRALLGLTLGCARCHDHKFDPVPTEDYYALAGIFRSTQTLDGESQRYVSDYVREPLPADPEHVAALEAYEETAERLKQELENAERRLAAASEARLAGIVVDDDDLQLTGHWKATTYSKEFVGEGYLQDENRNKGDSSVTLAAALDEDGTYEVRISYAPGGNRASAVPVTIRHAEGVEQLTVDQRKAPIDGMWRSLGEYPFAAADGAVVEIRNDGTDGYVLVDALQLLPPGEEAVRSDAPDETALAEAEARVERAKKRIGEHEAAKPPPLPVALAVRERSGSEVGDTFVCIRGEVENRGAEVPRGFLTVCSTGTAPAIPEDQSGRLQLADWLTDPDNPLTARVLVNRVWMHLLGEGIVRTVDNFGTLGEPPSHPRLLDTLAVRFVRDGWSMRRLIREIVNSRVYQLSSRYDAERAAVDPENRLLWRFNRRRLPVEALRDTMLVAAERLDRTPSVDPMRGYGTLVNTNNASNASVQAVESSRRTVYLPVIRGQITPLMAAFDFADPDRSVGRRDVTNVPAQALVMMNSPEVVAMCREIATRVTAGREAASREVQIEEAYLRCLQRPPSDEELAIAERFLGDAGSDREAWARWIGALIASTEYRLLD